jgi:hypothetical protein
MPDELPLEAGDEEDAEAGLDLESSADEELLPEGESEAGGHAPGSLKR